MTTRATFPKANRLIKRLDFDYLLANGTALHTKGLKLLFVRLPLESSLEPVHPTHARHAFALPKRYFKRATIRNYYRRRIREAVRLRQAEWLYSISTGGTYACLWVGDGRLSPRYKDIDQQVARLLHLAARNLNAPGEPIT